MFIKFLSIIWYPKWLADLDFIIQFHDPISFRNYVMACALPQSMLTNWSLKEYSAQQPNRAWRVEKWVRFFFLSGINFSAGGSGWAVLRVDIYLLPYDLEKQRIKQFLFSNFSCMFLDPNIFFPIWIDLIY